MCGLEWLVTYGKERAAAAAAAAVFVAASVVAVGVVGRRDATYRRHDDREKLFVALET